MRSVGGVLISLSWALSPEVDTTRKSVTHGQCDARRTVTFPAAGHHRPLTGTKLYCLGKGKEEERERRVRKGRERRLGTYF